MTVFERLYKPFENLDWPVFTLELRRGRRSDRTFLVVLIFVMVFAAVGYLALIESKLKHPWGSWSSQTYSIIAAAIVMLLRGIYSFLIVPSHCARAIASEKESRRFDALALTRLTSWEIIYQKLAQPVLYTIAITLLLLPLDIALARFSKMAMMYLMFGPVLFLVATVEIAAVSILCSCLCSTVKSAMILTYAVILFAPVLVRPGATGMLFLFGGLFDGPRASSSMNENYFLVAIGIGSLIIAAGISALSLFLACRKMDSLRSSV